MLSDAMLRTPQAAEYLGVSAATLCKWRVFGGGPRYKKLGRVVVYAPADLRDWLDARSRRSTSESGGERDRQSSAGALMIMTDMELLEACGPSWAAMTPDQRARYGPPLDDAPTPFTIACLIDLVLEFPRAVRSEGLAIVARRWDATPAVVALAEQLDRMNAVPATAHHKRTLATLPSTKPSSLMEVPCIVPRSLMAVR